ncbi:PREDICTED: tumor necrosis factor receptor superfamily member 14 [Galeopterus variegatus]|uniref:Tumor necrosis factor receptor superfamily member 14 n=1 Tax=Galeopterus variegatus TaxID=482537 RepID=A0ABM0R4M3_GALVR|nr:PREDICTED: tumor necrosis factor receptor superfamily member 14 [Galeopterus variegatus]
MEPLQVWGPAPWRPEPKADALGLALCLLLLGSPRSALALPPCKEEEYPVGTECCPKCSPGYHVKHTCGELTGTVCVPCPPRTYTAHYNGLSECLPCRVCDPAMGLVTRRRCSSTEDSMCGCSQGHFCITEDGDHCTVCLPHTICRPGQKMLKRGTERQDTVCQDCPVGTFSLTRDQEECQPWTRCSGWLVTEAEPGTSSSDATCSSSWVLYLVGVLVIAVLLVTFGLIWKWVKRKRLPDNVVRAMVSFQGKRRETTEAEATVSQAQQSPPDVTTVAVEETAPIFTMRDQNR